MKNKELFFPDYNGEGLINLMSSLEKSLGGKSKYPELNLLKASEISSKNIVLLIFDGMGYEFFKKKMKKSLMNNYLRGKITSVLSSGTSAAMTTIFTGESPQETGMVGWDVFLRELGTIADSLPYTIKSSKEKLGKYLNIREVFNFNPLANRIKFKSYYILPKEVSKTEFNFSSAGKAKIIPYKNYRGLFNEISKKVNSNNKKYILGYSYYPDKLLHKYGESKVVDEEMSKIEREFTKFLKNISKTDTTLIITADHGLREAKKEFDSSKYPELDKCLVLPICGEGGLGYCYVKAGKEKEFEKIIKTKFSNVCEIFKSKELADRGYFGKFKEYKEFRNRIGNYILAFKKNHANRSKLVCFEKNQKVGFHGGMTKEEIFVPLIVIKTKELK